MNRVISLSEPSSLDRIRVLSGMVTLPVDGKPTSWVTITRVGSFTDPRYGRFEITPFMLASMVRNFDNRTLGVDIFLDVNHQPGDGAAAKILKLSIEGGRLRALVEWKPFGVDAVKDRGFQYLSAEYAENFVDNEQGNQHGPVLLGAGLTVRPVIKGLDPVVLSSASGSDIPVFIHSEFAKTLSEAHPMNKALQALLERLKQKQLSQPVITTVKNLAETALANCQTDAEAEQICSQLEANIHTLAEAVGSAVGSPVINLSLTTGNQDVGAVVSKILAENEQKNRALAETTADRRKLLSDTINASALPDDLKRSLADKVSGLITATWSEEQVKQLANAQVEMGNQLSVNHQLAQIGFGPAGTPHITVPVETTRKLSQMYIDHLGKSEMAGKLNLQPEDKLPPFCQKVLAEFDRINGHQLDRELKVLSQGQGTTDMGSTQLPFGVQREVIRQALSDLNVLALVQTITDFSAQSTTLIPYEVRDTSQVVNDGIVYEGQAIPFAGIAQQMDSVHINPMKLALSITNEVMHFTRASAINWDAMGRNIEMNGRVLREMVHRRICNELQRASDSYLAVAVSNESFSAALTGEKSVIKTAQFPVVRPFQARDMQGNVVGSAENPLTVVLNSNVISAYDGTGKQTAGTYYRVVSYNLGTYQFVDQTGSPVTPANTGTNTISYSYATNVIKFDMDIPSGYSKEEYLNQLIQAVGGRKAMMSSQRFVSPDFLLMSPSLNDTVTNAEQFMRQYSRDGSGTNDTGDLERIKGVNSFGTNAPGVDLGDERILMGQKGIGAYVIAKPFVTGEPIEVQINGAPVGRKMAYGEEYNAIAVPKPVRSRFTSVVTYSSSGRAAI